jgi:putative CocE/NonD family hydrolase
MLGLPEYTSAAAREEVVMVSMDDGVKLVTEIYYPEGEGPWPVILIRNPYNVPGGAGVIAKIFTYYGYVGIHQTTRGRADSEGEWLPFFNERKDGLATLAWLTKQPWQNGNIGLFGASYLSMVQWAVADALPPEVKTMVPLVWGSDLHTVAYEGGMFRPEVATTWAALMHDETLDNFNMYDFYRAVRHRPHAEVDELFFGAKLPWYQQWLESDSLDAPLWQLPDAKQLVEVPELTQVPVLSIGGWNDIFLPSQLGDFKRLASRSKSRLIIGPWNHLTGVSDGIVPLDNAGDLMQLMGRIMNWFDHHLKGAPLEDWGPIETYAIRDDQWRRWQDWPPAAPSARLYFNKAVESNSCTGGALLNTPPVLKESVSYVYDPENPVPSRGGAGLLSFAIPGWGGTPPSMRDQKGLCERDDVLTFTSPKLKEDVHIMGKMRVALHVASDVDDTSFTAKVIDVAPDGTAVNIRDGITALSYRNGARAPIAYKPGELVELELEFWPIEWKVPKGHRIRVDISSSNFPAFMVHTNYAGPWAQQAKTRTANQTLVIGPETVGYLEVPVWR